MYDDLVRTLCRGISDEKDPVKSGELISLLQAVIREDQEEIRVRMQFLANKYASAITEINAAD